MRKFAVALLSAPIRVYRTMISPLIPNSCQLHAQLLGLCAGGAEAAWSRHGAVAYCAAPGALPSHFLAGRFIRL